MNGLLRNALIAFASIFAVGFGFGFLGAVAHSPSLNTLGTNLAPLAGILTFLFLQFRRGNRRVKLADPSAVNQAMTFDCPPGKAMLYVARTGLMGSAVGIDVLVDGVPVAQLQSPRFTCLELPPGEHEVMGMVGDGTSSLVPATGQTRVTLTPGTVTVLNLTLAWGLTRSKIAFSPWSTESARTKLAGIRMVEPQLQMT